SRCQKDRGGPYQGNRFFEGSNVIYRQEGRRGVQVIIGKPMTIERNETIRFHEQGTLNAVTRWIATHPEGIAELCKNVRRQYQADRADVPDENRTAVLLLQDARADQPARIGVLDVGGATLEDVTAWSTWQDPDASRRASQVEEEETQGNGGKAYMFRLFDG